MKSFFANQDKSIFFKSFQTNEIFQMEKNEGDINVCKS